ncbi:MAG: archease [Nanoarchaeota archaeon]
MNKKFEFLEHTGDVKFRAYGSDVSEVFENCALAVSSVFSRNGEINETGKKEFIVSEKNHESLLYQFIEELIYLFDVDAFVVSRAEVKLTGENDKITANVVVYGDDASNYTDLDAIKAPTYAEMYIKQLKNKKWEAQVVLDV